MLERSGRPVLHPGAPAREVTAGRVSFAGPRWDWGDGAPFDALTTALRRVRRGEGGTLLVRGSFGSGRSTLLRAAASHAEQGGFRTLRMFGHIAERDVSLGLVEQLMDALEGLDGRPGSLPDCGPTLYRVLRGLTRRSPVLLCVDDVQWVDPASLSCLGYVTRRIENLPLLIVVAVREGEPASDPAGVAELAGGGVCHGVVTLEPLTHGETVEVARRHASGASDLAAAAAGEVCWRLTRGNRLLLREAIRLLDTRVAVTDQTAAGPELAARVTADLERLAPRAVVSAIAELGDAADREMLAHVTGLLEHDCEDAVRALTAAGFVRADRAGLVHPLVRATVVAHTSATVRAALHGSAACRLRSRRSPAERIARHLLHVSPGFRPWAAETLLSAAHAEILHRGPGAAPLIDRALRENLPASTGAELVIELGRAFLRRDIAGAPPCFDRAAALTAVPRLLADAAVGKATALFHLGRHDEARRTLEPVAGSGPLRSLFTTSPVPAGWVPRAGLGHLDLLVDCLGEFRAGRLTEEACDREAARARQRGDLCHEAVALLMRGHLALSAGRLAVARRGLAEAQARLVEAGAARTSALLRLAFTGQAEAAVRSGDTAAAARALDATAGFDRLTSAWWDAVLLVTRAEVRVAAGDVDRARADLLNFHDWLDGRSDAPALISSRRARAAVLAHRTGLGDHARRFASRALDVARAAAPADRAATDPSGGHLDLGLALHAFGVVHGDPDALLRATRLLAGTRARLDTAQAHVDLGAELRRRRRNREARHHLREGLTLGVVCGSDELVARAEDELVVAGGRLRRPPPHLLTNGEERVAVLAGEGLSNGEIARRLCITRRTVEAHLTRTYRKLSITNRSQLPRALRDHCLPHD
ncbi:helix-turn-helix transcriptional regulator [Actinomadura spongiicola]|uniref:Helix-turn-helix transcriptional regulator n=1 Tax=Actinomadura spongiicola TaxID=2303421 RepID=A0A372GC44_9ACTN|nr:LuxR family transcriptional regulator [Actinomadura spongiicola]RFS82978.1 helix-turn-helix transcriptional regulator [Actinomadura spongiicola]